MQPTRVRLSLGLAAALVALLCAAGAAAAAPSPTIANSAPGSIGIRLLDVPAAQSKDPRARLYVVDHLAPGTTIHRRIEISNTTTATAHVAVYAAAATIAGGSFLGAEGHTQNDLSTWTTTSPGILDVPAGQTENATVTVTVPRDAAPGEQYGAVWAEVRSASSSSGGVMEVSRVGIRLYISVGPGGAPAADFVIDALTAKRSDDGQPMVVASVHNTGGRALDMNGTLQLGAGPGGLSAGPFPASLGVTLGIGATEPVTIVLDKSVPAGPWHAQILLRSGLVERRADATITFPATGGSPPVKASPPAKASPILPLIVGALAAFLLAAAVLAMRRWRRHLRETRLKA